jgi:hypothetical protein
MATVEVMCRNITTLRGLEPVATEEEIVAAATTDLIAALPPRKVPPRTEPPLRRLARQG